MVKSGLTLIGALLVIASFQRLARMTEQFWEEFRGEVSLPVDLNPVCANPQIHQVEVRIDGDYKVGDNGLPIVSIYAVMPVSDGQSPTLVRSCLVPLPYSHTYTSRTCDPYSFGTYGVRNGSCEVWIDGVLQPECEGFVMPPGTEAVLPAEPAPELFFVITQTYFVLLLAVSAARSSKQGESPAASAERRN